MQENIRELKKKAFLELRDDRYTFDEISKILNCTQRTLFNWQNEQEDINFNIEVEQKVTEQKQVEQKEIDELRERIENLNHYYENLWRTLHTQKEPTPQEKAEAIIFQMMLERSFQNEKVIEMQRERTREIWETHKLIENRPLWDNTEDNLKWQREMDKWNERLEKHYRYPQ